MASALLWVCCALQKSVSEGLRGAISLKSEYLLIVSGQFNKGLETRAKADFPWSFTTLAEF